MVLCIKNGTVVFEHDIQKVDILIEGGKIAGIFQPGKAPEGVEVLDVSGLYIMPGSIDPHTHWGIYKDLHVDVYNDSRRNAIGGLTSLVTFHRHNDDYFETVPEHIKIAEENSVVDFSMSLGLIKKSHVNNIERYGRELKITSFKFFLDKTNILEDFYKLDKGTGLLGNKREILDILVKMREIDPKLLLCLHCEDTEIFYPEKQRVFQSNMDQYSLSSFSAARPDFGETSAVLSALWVNNVAEGNIYIVHMSAASGVKMARALLKELKGRVGIETCPHYLVLDENSPCKLNGTVVPPIRTKSDSEELWQGIIDGTITSMGSDNCPIDLAQKYAKGNDISHVITGFPNGGMILPVLISEGYHKRNIPLYKLSQVNSINTARTFNLPNKGEIKVGFDADLAIVDLDWERTINQSLFEGCDFSIYEGMTFKGWPRYTMVRGNIVQKDGKIVENCPKGKFIAREI